MEVTMRITWGLAEKTVASCIWQPFPAPKASLQRPTPTHTLADCLALEGGRHLLFERGEK